MAEQTAIKTENALSIGDIQLSSSVATIHELTSLAKAIILDEVFAKYLGVVRYKELVNANLGRDYCG